ncbi:hypothetical protein [Streptomyces achromogenes]|uniref:hypothetical protein n=1 Tax=Streptomyces achromogenes TaxID=67255 RepID=UPI00367AB293
MERLIMTSQEALEALRTAIRAEERKAAAARLMALHDESARGVRPGLWLAAITLDPSLDTFSDN